MAEIGSSGLLGAIVARLKHLSARQTVIAGNLANADTPGFQARVLDEPKFSSMLIKKPRIGAGPDSQPPTRASGAQVDVESELMAMSRVQMDYATMTNLYKKQVGLIKIALGRGGTSV